MFAVENVIISDRWAVTSINRISHSTQQARKQPFIAFYEWMTTQRLLLMADKWSKSNTMTANIDLVDSTEIHIEIHAILYARCLGGGCNLITHRHRIVKTQFAFQFHFTEFIILLFMVFGGEEAGLGGNKSNIKQMICNPNVIHSGWWPWRTLEIEC